MSVFCFETSIGCMQATVSAEGALQSLALTDSANKGPVPALFKHIVQQMRAYLSKQQTVFNVPLDLQGTAFQQRVWKKLLAIPFGQTVSYAQLAEQVSGNRLGARAVGNAVGSNPCLIIVPCHRVLAANQRLGGFSAGIEVKKTLLSHEGICTLS